MTSSSMLSRSLLVIVLLWIFAEYRIRTVSGNCYFVDSLFRFSEAELWELGRFWTSERPYRRQQRLVRIRFRDLPLEGSLPALFPGYWGQLEAGDSWPTLPHRIHWASWRLRPEKDRFLCEYGHTFGELACQLHEFLLGEGFGDDNVEGR